MLSTLFASRPRPTLDALPRPLVLPDHAAFDKIVLAGGGDALVLFGTVWCRPGQRTLAPMLCVAQRRGIAAFSVNVDRSPELARRYRVMAIPSLLLFRDGQEAARRIGEMGKRDLDNWFALALA